jgi:gamma-glutamyl phosphate reductase
VKQPQIGADAVFFVSEAWTAKAENVPPGGFAVDATDRGEAIVLHGADASGEQIALSANVVRKKVKKHKVKSLSSTHVDTTSQNMVLTPFIEVWGRLDVLMPREGEEGFVPR